SLMPPEVSSRLQHHLTDMGVHLLLKSQLQKLEKTEAGIRATLDNAKERPRYGVVHPTGWIRNGQHIGRADKMSGEFVSSEV
ncbi:hypothetical protein MJM99_35755, partial [Salmonella enterica subsp. enterica serovar Kentucky]|nr:hypothetical protein [Salmonella enterica subsp. enterica serovar Kentucky]